MLSFMFIKVKWRDWPSRLGHCYQVKNRSISALTVLSDWAGLGNQPWYNATGKRQVKNIGR